MKSIEIQRDPSNGKPLVTSRMKAECIGEFFHDIEVACGDCDGEDCLVCGGEGTFMLCVTVPWTTVKDIYKMMAKVSARELETALHN